MKQVNLGLIGSSLKHSFSKAYFEKKFQQLQLPGYAYHNFEIRSADEIKKIVAADKTLRGLNVTHPYKQAVIPLMDTLSAEAKQTGAVNCVYIKEDGTLHGYNTDVYGFRQSLKPFLEGQHDVALVLGTGGAGQAVAYAFSQMGLKYMFVTSSAQKKAASTLYYHEINEIVMRTCRLIVNATPLGMFPNVNESPPLPYGFFTENHLAYDLVYNPGETLFLKQAAQRGAITLNGLSMLHLQAEKSWEIWNNNGLL